MACVQSNLELLNLLIDKGAKVDLADEEGETALHIAVRNHFTEGVKALITRGHANVNLPEKINAWTPLIIAGKYNIYIYIYFLFQNPNNIIII